MKRIGVIGAGGFGLVLLESLARRGSEVLLLERDMATAQRMSAIAARVVQGDATDVNVLSDAGFHECDAVVVAIGTNMEGSILATLNLKEMKVPYVVARAVSETHGKVLERIGADLVVYPDKERAQRLARTLVAASPLDYFEISDGVSLVEIGAPKSLVGKNAINANLRKTHGVTVLAIKRAVRGQPKPRIIVDAVGNETIEKGDRLVVFGPDGKLDDLA